MDLKPRPPVRTRAARGAWIAVSVALAAAAFLGDWLSGAEVSFLGFYLISIAVATWFVSRRAGLALSLFSAVGWVAAYFLTGGLYSRPGVLYWNVGMDLAIFLFVTFALARVRSGLETERTLAQELELAWNRLDREMRSVGDLQRSLLPVEMPRLDGFPMAVHYATSTRAGGDYYDFLALEDGRLGILIADASGHGAPAAVLMAMTRVVLHTSPEALAAPARLLSLMNALLCRTIPQGQFVTACYALLAPGLGTIEYALAGHPPPLVARDDGRIEELGSPDGPPLGIFGPAAYSHQSATLRPGDTVLLYTDGLIEAADAAGRLLGVEWLRREFAHARDLDPAALCERLAAGVRAHTGPAPPTDDLTMLVLRAAASACDPDRRIG